MGVGAGLGADTDAPRALHGYCARVKIGVPEYIQRPSTSPTNVGRLPHVVTVVLDGIEFATAGGETLKAARQNAAEETLGMLSKVRS